LYPLFNPVETAHGETKVEDDEGETGHKNSQITGQGFSDALDVTKINNEERSLRVPRRVTPI